MRNYAPSQDVGLAALQSEFFLGFAGRVIHGGLVTIHLLRIMKARQKVSKFSANGRANERDGVGVMGQHLLDAI